MNNRFSGRFSDAILSENAAGRLAVIPDIKCVSPKEGDLLRGRDPVDAAKFLVRMGTPVLSVVTEKESFGGGPELLRAVVDATRTPVLRKDFITDEKALEETAESGAAAVLLICAVTDEKTLIRLYESAIKLGLEPLVEVCSADEMKFAVDMDAGLIGINNRNIKTLELDDGGPSRTVALAPGSHKGALLISESGIKSRYDAQLAASAGANAVLAGTALWRAEDMGAMYQSLRVEWSGEPCARR